KKNKATKTRSFKPQRTRRHTKEFLCDTSCPLWLIGSSAIDFKMNTSELIYDWNKKHPPGLKPQGPVLLNDESLRDGLQSPSVRDPSIPEKLEILHLMEAL